MFQLPLQARSGRCFSAQWIGLVAVAALLLGMPNRAAAQFTWDPNISNGTNPGGSGNWSTAATLTNWFTTSNVAWTNGSAAVFTGTGGGAAPFIVTIDPAGVSATQLTFNTSGYVIGGGPLTLTGASLFTVAAGNTATINSAIAGTTGIVASGDGTLILGGGNVATGTFTINGATAVQLASANALNVSAPMNVTFGASSTGVLRLSGNSVTIGTLNSNATPGTPVVENASASAATLTLNSGTAATFAGVIQDGAGGGALSVTKLGTSNLTLTGANTFTGNLTIGGGTVTIGNGTLAGGLAANVNFINSTSTAISTLSFNPNAGGLTYAGSISGLGAVTKAGTNTLTLAGTNNTYTGATTVTGTLVIANDGGLSPFSAVTLNASSSLQFGAGVTAPTIGSLAGSGSLQFANANPLTLTIGGNGGSPTYTGAIPNSPGGLSLVKIGTGTQTLAGTLAGGSTYSGSTIINAGSLQLDFNNAAAPAADILPSTTNVTLSSQTRLVMAGKNANTSTQTIAGLTLNVGPSQVVANNGTGASTVNLNLNGITRNTGSAVNFTLPVTGLVTTTTPNASFAGGSATILGGYATVGGNTWAVASGAAPFPIIGLANASYDLTFGPGTDADVQAGITNLAGPQTSNSLRFNSGGGPATVNLNGDLTVATGGILVTTGVNANPITFNNNTITSGNGQDLIVTQNSTGSTVLTFNSGVTGAIGLTKVGPGTLVMTGNNDYTGGTQLTQGTIQIGDGVVSGTLPGNVTNHGTLAFNPSATGFTYGANITGSGNVAKLGTGTLTLSGVNSYTGSTMVNAGTLAVDSATALPSNSSLQVAAGSNVQFGATVSAPSFGGLAGGGTLQFNSASPVNVTVGNGSGFGSFAGNIQNSTAGVSVTKVGTGTLALSSSNTYQGGTTVNSGTLIVAPPAAGMNPFGTGTLTLGGGTVSFRQITPLATSGYIRDLISTTSELGQVTRGYQPPGLDIINGQGLFQAGSQPFGQFGGLPAIGDFISAARPGTITAPAVTFMMQPYTANNTLLLANPATSPNALQAGLTNSGTITLESPQQFKNLYLLVNSTNGASAFTATVNFSDATSTQFTGLSAADWFNGTPIAIQNLGRILNNGGYDNNTGTLSNPRLYQIDLNLAVGDQTKTVTSVTISSTMTGNTSMGVYGISGFGTNAPITHTYANNVAVTADSTIDLRTVNSLTMGGLSIGSNTLTVNADFGANVNLGATSVTGNATFNPGLGVGVSLSSLNGGGGVRSISKNGQGNMQLTGNATGFAAGSVLNVNSNTMVLGDGTDSTPWTNDIVSRGATVFFPGPSGSTFNAAISGPGSVGLTGGNNLTLAGANSYGGATAVNAGTLTFANPGAIPQNSTLAVAPTGNVQFGATVAAPTVGGLQGGGTLQFANAGPVTMTVGSGNGFGTYGGSIATPAGGLSVVKSGTGTQALIAANTYAGGTTVNNGTLIVAPTASGVNPTGTGPINLAGGTLSYRLVSPLATSGYNRDVITGIGETAQPFRGISGPGFDFGGQFAFYQNGVTNGGLGGMPSSGAFISARAAVSAANPAATAVLQPYSGNNVLLLANPTTANAAFQTGLSLTGTITLANPSSFNRLYLFANSANGASTFSATLNFADSTTAVFTGLSAPDWFFVANPAIQGLGRIQFANGTFTDANLGTANPRLYEVGITLAAGDQTKVLNSITFTTTGTGNTALGIYGISGIGTTVSTSQTYGNDVVVSNSSTLDLRGVTALSLGNMALNSGVLSFAADQAPANVTVASLAGSANANLNGVTLTVGNASNVSSTFSGVIANGSATSNVIKDGGGTLTIATGSTQTYSGTTSIRGGRLAVDGTLNAGGGIVTVGNGAPDTGTLSGTGFVNRVITLTTGGTLAPGNTANIGVLSTDSLPAFTGGTFRTNLAAAGLGNFGQLNITAIGTLALGTGTALAFDPFAGAVDSSFFVITGSTTGVTGSFANFPVDQSIVFTNPTTLTDYLIFYGSFGGAPGSVVIAPVPEPATVLLISGLGAGSVGLIRRRMRRVTA